MTHTTCHCGAAAVELGNGVDNLCAVCLKMWTQWGEPEICPCVRQEIVCKDCGETFIDDLISARWVGHVECSPKCPREAAHIDNVPCFTCRKPIRETV